MLLPAFQELIKPQWLAVIGHLKTSGGLPVSELSERIGASYMAVKQHCEELKELGYLDRTRLPRTAVGRPEIFYSLAHKADALFPQAGVVFTLELMEDMRALFGESTPDKLLFQYFQKQHDKWRILLEREISADKKWRKLLSLRRAEGCFIHVSDEPESSVKWEEFHNPLQRIFDRYPRVVTMELRMMEQLLGAKITRKELDGGRTGQPRVMFEISRSNSV